MTGSTGILLGRPRPLEHLPPRTIETFRNQGYASSLTKWLPYFSQLKPGEFVELSIGTKRNTIHAMIQRLQKRGYIEGGYTVRKRLGRLYLTRDLAVRSEKLPPMFGEKLLRWIAKTETLQEGEMIEIKEAPSAARHAIKRLSELNQLTEGYVVRVRKLRTNQPEVYLVRLSADPETREIQLDLIGRNVKKTKNKA